jgi:hypothetical protein
MSINVNTVYTTVLTILNKEQRGYLTPFEFNNVANQVQLEIFEKFFEDYNQYTRMPQTDVEFASRMDHIMEEFQVFETSANASNTPTTNIYTQPSDLHRFGSASWNKGTNSPPIEILTNKVYNQIKLSDLTQPSDNLPVAKYNKNQLTVFPDTTPYASSDVTFNYIRKPKDVRWGYSIGGLGQYIYDSSTFDTTSLVLNSNFLPNASLGTATSGSYINIPTTSSGNGVGAIVTVSLTGSGSTNITTTNPTIVVTSQGTGYEVGDTLTIAAGAFGSSTNAITTTPITTQQLNSANSTIGSTNFEISDSQQTEVILEILKYSGIIIRDPQIVQAASQELAQEEVNSKR